MKRLLSILAFLFTLQLQATTYYISTSGNGGSDSNAGTIGSPFLTLGKAESVAVGGDIVIVNNGTFAGFTASHSGTSGNPITFQVANTGGVMISSTITLTGNWRTFSGFNFTNVSDRSFSITGTNNIVLNSTISISSFGTGYGILVGADANTGGTGAQNNTIDNLRLICTSTSGQNIHGVIFGGGASNNTLKNSYIDGPYYGFVDKVTTGSKCFNNVFNQTVANLNTCIYAKGSANGQYNNNTLRVTGSGSGILLNVSDGGSPSVTLATIRNNIYIKPAGEFALFDASPSTNTYTSDYNVYQYSSGTVFFKQGVASYSTLSAWQSVSGQDLHSIAATPTFTNGSGTMTQKSDYTPGSTSPAINIGTIISGRTTDAVGNSLVSVPDIGAVEYQSAGSNHIYFVSTTGSDSNPGTLASPFKTLQKALTLTLSPGDIIYIRAGTYNSGATSNSPSTTWAISGKNGNSANEILISAYPGDFPSGGRVVFNCADFSYTNNHFGIAVNNCSYLRIKGIRVTGIPQHQAGQVMVGWFIGASGSNTNITIEDCESDHIGNTGFRIDGPSNNVTFLNCDAHHIDNPFDPGVQQHGGADGFGRYDPSNTSTGTVYKNCRAWFCSDDGWDCFGSPGTITYDGCWAFWSGYVQDVFPLTHTQAGVSWGDGNGIKFGGNTTPKDAATIKRTVIGCFSFENFNNAFDQNQAAVGMVFYNNTAFKCGARGFMFYTGFESTLTAYNNLVYQCGSIQNFFTGTTQSNNSWNGFTPSVGDFAGLSTTGADAARPADGSLPVMPLMHLAAGSQFIDAGKIVSGRVYNGTAPDIGAFESGGSTPINQPPVANAGTAQTITLPTNSATLSGSGTDADGTIQSYHWILQSGTAGGTISNANIAGPSITGLVAGVNTYQLTVTDNKGATATSTVKITVVDPSPLSPVANAGANKNITLPTNSVTLTGSGSDPDGTIASYAWTKVSGGAATIVSAASATTNITGLVAGPYVFRLTVTDQLGHTGSATVNVTVNSAAPVNIPPNADAGANATITLPTSTGSLNGSASSDPDGTISTYAWSKLSGPAGGTISNSAIASPTLSALQLGQYVFRLIVTDNSGAKDTAQTIRSVVDGSPLNPVADAGPQQTITLPTSSTTLDGSNSADADGTISTYAWSKLPSSPTGGTISNSAIAGPTVSGLIQGTYQFKLTVTDNTGHTGSDTVSIFVNPVPPVNLPPQAVVPKDTTIFLPDNSLTLAIQIGFSDTDIVAYQLSRILYAGNGVPAETIVSPTSATTDVTGLSVAGTYTFQWTITDANNLSDTKTFRITVSDPASLPPPPVYKSTMGGIIKQS